MGGTTHGLLAHRDNDVGTLGSLPARVDGKLLASWVERLDADSPQRLLLRRILDVLPEKDAGVSAVDDGVRQALADVVRKYYQEDRSRTQLQAKLDLAWWGQRTQARAQQ